MESNDVNVFVSYCITACQNKIIRAGFKGGQAGQLPRASTNRGASTKQ